MAMYQIWTNGPIAPKLLAIMPGDVMRKAFRLAPEAIARVERETQNNGLCALYSQRREYIEGFGNNVLVSLFDEGRLA